MQLKKIRNYCVLTLLIYVSIEALFFISGSIFYKQILTPRQFFKMALPENPYNPIAGDEDCSSAKKNVETLGPHPYLAYVRLKNVDPNCTVRPGNNVGMDGKNFPIKRDSNNYVILITGGSVAAQLARETNLAGESNFEKYLNDHFLPPKGKHFQVLSAAQGDYRVPQNVISTMFFSDVIDAVIEVSGYNESHNFEGRKVIETPSPNFWAMFDLEKANESNLLRKNFHSQLNKFESSFLIDGSFTYALISKLRVLIMLRKFEVTLENSSARYYPNKTYFDYDASLTMTEITEQRKNKLRLYYLIQDSICKKLTLKCSFFVQPIPTIAKKLTVEETSHLSEFDFKKNDIYPQIVQLMKSLKKDGLDVTDLTNLFVNENDTIYKDHIHFKMYPKMNFSKGNEIMTKEIAAQIKKTWFLKTKPIE